jgi:hypothetical protein
MTFAFAMSVLCNNITALDLLSVVVNCRNPAGYSEDLLIGISVTVN